MSKAILIMEMPSSCSECPCVDELFGCIRVCNRTGECISGYTVRRQDDCPLREVPQKSNTGKSDYYQWGDWEDGYNACIDDILGGGE